MTLYAYVAALRANGSSFVRYDDVEADDAVKALADAVTIVAEEFGDGAIEGMQISVSRKSKRRPAGGSDATGGRGGA